MENTGGQAFPVVGDYSAIKQRGMTLRDYFAAKAMQGMMVEVDQPSCDYIADVSYKIADAMLKVRDA